MIANFSSMFLNATFLVDKDMAIEKLCKLNSILWLIKVNVGSGIGRMLQAAKGDARFQR